MLSNILIHLLLLVQIINTHICEQSDSVSTNKLSPESSANSFFAQVSGRNSINYAFPSSEPYQDVWREKIVSSQAKGLGPLGEGVGLDDPGQDVLQAQDSFGRWMTNIIADSPGSADDQALGYSMLTVNQPLTSQAVDNQLTSSLRNIFNITEVSPAWAVSTEETKVVSLLFFFNVCLCFSLNIYTQVYTLVFR